MNSGDTLLIRASRVLEATASTTGLASNSVAGARRRLPTAADSAGIGQAIQQLFSDWGAGTAEESFIELGVDKVGEVEPENDANYLIPGYLVMFVFFCAATVTYANSNESLVRKPRLLVCPNWNDSAHQLGVSP